MPIPPKAFILAEMDPAELLDYKFRLKQPGTKLLEDNEAVDTFTLALYPEAIALGLEIKSGGGYDESTDGDNITVWFEIDELFWDDVAYDGDGAGLAMELTLVTDNVPPRRRQRTLVLQVVQL